MNNQLFALANRKRNTNHVLHLLLCIPTLGLWLIVWVIVSTLNYNHNQNIDRQIDRIVEYKADGFSDTETFAQVKADKVDDDAFRWKLVVGIVVVILYFYLR